MKISPKATYDSFFPEIFHEIFLMTVQNFMKFSAIRSGPFWAGLSFHEIVFIHKSSSHFPAKPRVRVQ